MGVVLLVLNLLFAPTLSDVSHAVLGFDLQSCSSDMPVDRGAVLSDTSGALAEIVLQFASQSADEVLPTYRSFLTQLEPDTVVYIVCECDEDLVSLRGRLEQWCVPELERIHLHAALGDHRPGDQDAMRMGDVAMPLVGAQMREVGAQRRAPHQTAQRPRQLSAKSHAR